MNVEAQTIAVPTGLQDYRPALYGGMAALELDVDGVRRVPLRSIPASSNAASSSATRANRGTPAPTTGRSRRSTSTATGTSSTASSAFATPPATMREALARGDWEASAVAIADRMGEPQAAGARRDDSGDRGADRAGAWRPARRRRKCAAPAAAGACSATVRPTRAPRFADGARGRRRAAARLHASSATASRVDNRAIAQHPRRDRRPARDQGREPVQDPRVSHRPPTSSAAIGRPCRAAWTRRRLREMPGIGKDLAARIRELAETGDVPLSSGAARTSSRRPFSTCCACRASARRRWRCSTPRSNVRSAR